MTVSIVGKITKSGGAVNRARRLSLNEQLETEQRNL